MPRGAECRKRPENTGYVGAAKWTKGQQPKFVAANNIRPSTHTASRRANVKHSHEGVTVSDEPNTRAWRADAIDVLDATVAGLGGETRDGQQELTRAISDALRDGHHLVAAAPTGSGKSLAYLAPAVASGRRVVVATATIALQTQLITRDLPTLEEFGGVDFSFALLKGR